MNTEGFRFDKDVLQTLTEFDRSARMPHAVIIESPDTEKALDLAVFLSMYAVCGEKEKPCGMCKNCRNAKNKAHADITYPQLQAQKKAYTVEQMRELMKDAYVLPNDAEAKVYIFERADERFTTLIQNTFLKLFEEPPQNVYFILLCKSAQSLLDTILSRFTILRVKGDESFDEETLQAAKAIVGGILQSREYPLMQAVYTLNKENYSKILAAVKRSLRDALAVLSGAEPLGDKETAQRLSGRLTRKKTLEMIELCDSFDDKMKQNVNNNLLTAWLCGEFRRITWQR